MANRTSIPFRLRFGLAAVLALRSHPASAAAAAEPPAVRIGSETSAEKEADDQADEMIPLAWLDAAVSVEEVEAAHPGITDDRLQHCPAAARPFGFENPRWEALKSEMQAGDVLWTFASPAESWQHRAGRAGIALLRGGKVVDTIVTMMN